MVRELYTDHTEYAPHVTNERVNHTGSTVDEQWVRPALLQSIHLNSESVGLPVVPKYRKLPSEFHSHFDPHSLEVMLIHPDNRAGNNLERVFSILINSNIRRGNRAIIEEHLPAIKQRVEGMVRLGRPIEIVLPTLPFKDQSPLTTRHSLEQVDLGEYLHFAQLRNICASVEAVYEPGAKIILLTDGLVYSDFFAGGQREPIEQYRRNCVQIRDELGLHGRVEIIDMDWLVRNEPQSAQVQRQIASILRESERNNPQICEVMQSLERGMLLNIPVPEYDFDSYASLLSQPLEKLPQSLQERTHETALQYASFLLAMQRVGIVEHTFPDALRATVHPKNAPQLPVHLVNKHSVTFPYNGVPVVSERKLERTNSFQKSTRIMRYYRVIAFSGNKRCERAEGF